MHARTQLPHRLLLAWRLLWVLPCSLVGLLWGLVLLAFGGGCRRVGRTLEFYRFADTLPVCSRWHSVPYGAITLGHVILGIDGCMLEQVRSHERVHVRQYERWGPLFFIAYPASSLWALLCGKRPYWDNAFERAAYRLQDDPVIYS